MLFKKRKNFTIGKCSVYPEISNIFSTILYNLKAGWEKEMSDVWSPDDIKQFKQRQETFGKIPSEVRDRTKIDKSYREGWVDVASWILQHNLC